MATALITLTTAGADTDNFSLFSDATGYGPYFESGISRASLLAGHTSNSVPAGTTIIRVKSNSVGCSNYIDIAVGGITTSTTTTTTTLPPSNSFLTNWSINDITIGFQLYARSGGASYTLFYATPAPVTILKGGTYGFYTTYPGGIGTGTRSFKLVISAGSTGIVGNASAFYLNSNYATTSVVNFSSNTPTAGAFQAANSYVNLAGAGDNVSFIDAYITTTF